MGESLFALLPGLAIGAVVGALAQFNTFCSVGAIADILLAKDWRRARTWLMALAVAIIGTQVAGALGAVSVDASIYRQPVADPILLIIGGIAFGYGMASAGGCLQRALVRIGAGSVKSLVTVIVMAV